MIGIVKDPTLPPLSDNRVEHCVKKHANFKKRSHGKKSCDSKHGEFHEKCNYLGCDAVFKSRFNLRRHVLLCHTNLRPFECEICGRKFGLNQHRLDHLLTHELDPVALKEMISKRVSLRSSLPIFRVEYADSKKAQDLDKKGKEKREEEDTLLGEVDSLSRLLGEWNEEEFLARRVLPFPEVLKQMF